jgi:ATP-dependent exoDNAse (exonuclease V) alpha subunit
VHKSQGLTLNRVVLDIKDKDNIAGLTYVAVSRVKKLSGLMFERGFDKERFQPSTSKAKEA